MRRHLKTIATFFTMAVMLVMSSVPAIASEINSDAKTAIVTQQSTDDVTTVSNEDNIMVTSALGGQFHYTGRLSKNKVLGTVYINSACRTVKWTVGRTGSDGLVNLELTNTSTGEVRHISAQANNVLGSMTWVGSGIPKGNWQVKVVYVSGLWNYDVDLYFYN